MARELLYLWAGNRLCREDAQMKKTLITMAMAALVMFMAVSVSWGATPDTATWETATWETIAPGTIW